MCKKKPTVKQRNLQQAIAREAEERRLLEEFESEDSEFLTELLKLTNTSKEQWFERRLKEWDDKQLKVPTGQYQDSNRIFFTYQQKFVEMIRELVPKAIEELRDLVPDFKFLFNKNNEKYLDVFFELRVRLFTFNSYLRNVAPYRPYDDQYYWGELEFLISLIANDFAISKVPNFQELPDSIKRLIEEKKSNIIRPAQKAIVEAFKETAEDEENILKSFLILKLKLFEWTKKYNLQKDWLIEYAFYFLFQFSTNPSIPIEDLEINPHYYKPLQSSPVEFQFRGWWAGGEDKESYEKEVCEAFQKFLDKYFDNAWRHLELGDKKKGTKQPDIIRKGTSNCLKWLVRWTVQNWEIKKIVENDLKVLDTIKTRNLFLKKVNYIKEELPKLELYKLPYRKPSE